MTQNIQALEALISSIDDKSKWKIVDYVVEKKKIITAQLTNKVWKDNAPVLKCFDRDEWLGPLKLEPGTYKIVEGECSMGTDRYYFEDGWWYKF